MAQPIVQSGTSRFLLAHVTLFVSQAQSRGPAAQALGGICVVQTTPAAPLSIFPCELIERNGDTLRDLLTRLACQWSLSDNFVAWLRGHGVWADSLVDRIDAQALQPVGAVAEPHALWAIEQQPRLQLPCLHESIVLTDDLARHARLKLFLLNGGHSFLAELRERRLNPFLAHRLAEIAHNHAQKKQRRFAPLLALADEHALGLPQPRLRAALSNPQ